MNKMKCGSIDIKKILWVAIGALLALVVYFIFLKQGNAAAPSAMVGGC